jgi:hypothetical protein
MSPCKNCGSQLPKDALRCSICDVGEPHDRSHFEAGSFVSYATETELEFEAYRGEKDWEDLTTVEQDTVLLETFVFPWAHAEREKINTRAFMRFNLRKEQWNGLQAVWLALHYLTDWLYPNENQSQRQETHESILRGTKFIRRLKQAATPPRGLFASRRVRLRGNDLARLGRDSRGRLSNDFPMLCSDLMKMKPGEAMEYLRQQVP